MTLTLQYVIDALNVGGLYALMALGIGLIFGIMRLINFAHGEMVMVGGYAMLLLIDLPGPAVVGVSILAVVAPGAGHRTPGVPAIARCGAVDAARRFVRAELLPAEPLRAALRRAAETLRVRQRAGDRPASRPGADCVAATGFHGAHLAALAGLTVLLKRTSIGVQLRAASQDFRAARLCGVRANSVIAFAFAISGALAWIVSLIYSAQIGQLSPAMGVRPVVIGFVATILGGLGSLVGAVVGGFFVGALAVALEAGLSLELRPFKEAVLFALVFLVLLLRPQGLVAVRALRERV